MIEPGLIVVVAGREEARWASAFERTGARRQFGRESIKPLSRGRDRCTTRPGRRYARRPPR
jgi:hypothetical protein